MHKHIRQLKRHRNILYGVSGVLLVLQLATIVFILIYFGGLGIKQDKFQKEVVDSLENIRVENRFAIIELAGELNRQKEEVAKTFAWQEESFIREIYFLRESQSDFSEIAERAVKGVVSVSTDKSAGSGFFIEGGYVITNEHVLSGSNSISIQTYSGQSFPVFVVGSNSSLDIAILKINGSLLDEISPLELADSNIVNVGDEVLAIGNPLGLSFSVTRGIISAIHRRGPNGLDAYLQTDVTLNPGNSGGPLINKEGEVVGMNNFKVGNAESLGFALESNYVLEFAERTIPGGLDA